MSFRIDLAGKVALVTGASSGLGAHFAETLAAAGAAVVLAARRRERLERLAAEIGEAGGRAAAVALDVNDPGSIREGIAAGKQAFGGLDILINNAGITDTRQALETTPESWDAIVDTNLKGCFFVAQAVARGMVAGDRPGSIVNIGSITGLRAIGQIVPYAVSKAGLAHMTRLLALEWARHGIRVNALAPGYIITDFNRDFLLGEAGEAMKRRVPQRRYGNLAELDGPLLLLAGDAGSFMTGAVIPVDGGHLLSSL